MIRILYILGGVSLGVKLGHEGWSDIPDWIFIVVGVAMLLIADIISSLRRSAERSS